jgi:hypothetical protein
VKPDPSNPNRMIVKDPHTGRKTVKPITDEFLIYWDNK